MCECKITIVSDDAADAFAEKLMKAMDTTVKKYQLGTSTYSQQFAGKSEIL